VAGVHCRLACNDRYVGRMADDPSTDPKPKDPGDDDEPLGDFQRIIAGVAGAAAAGAGTIATFVDGSNPGGAPLLLGVGALFLYLALTGQRLTRLEAGGAKAELARTRRAIEKVIIDPHVPDEA
jgi:hypothetical protein